MKKREPVEAHKQKYIALILVIILFVIAILSLILYIVYRNAPIESECELDSECIPASCCHSSACVPSTNIVNCSGIFCTQECVSETLDCGQGTCKCLKNKCIAILP